MTRFAFVSLVVLFSISALACGNRGGGGDGSGGPGPFPMGGSGVPAASQLATLSEADRTSLCEYIVEVQGGPGAHECGDGVTVEVPTVAECVMESSMFPAECGITVGQAEDCAEAIGTNQCMPPPAAMEACGPIIDCALMGMGGT